jgi:hypothetical protein
MNMKLWIFLSPWWLGCGGIVDMGTVVGPAQGGAGGTGSGSGQGPDGTFEHELVQVAGWGLGMCGLFSDERVRCWMHRDDTAREVPDLTGVAMASDSMGGGRVCVVERSGKVACRDNDCFDKPEPCWFPGETIEIVGIQSAASIWMSGCQGLALRSDGLLQQWVAPGIPCEGNVPPLLEPRTVHEFFVFSAPLGFGEPIATIPGSGSFGFVTESGRAFHTRVQPSSTELLPAEFAWYDHASWPPSVIGAVDDAVAVASSYEATAILRRSGRIWAFGNERALGIGRTEQGVAEGEVLGIDDAVAVAAGQGMCAIRSDRSLWCWGPSSHGQLGVGGPPDEYGAHLANLYLPVKVPDAEGVRAVGMTPSLTCVVRGANEVWCWGFPNTWAEPYRVSFR